MIKFRSDAEEQLHVKMWEPDDKLYLNPPSILYRFTFNLIMFFVIFSSYVTFWIFTYKHNINLSQEIGGSLILLLSATVESGDELFCCPEDKQGYLPTPKP